MNYIWPLRFDLSELGKHLPNRLEYNGTFEDVTFEITAICNLAAWGTSCKH
jgi:hypothetical protein